MEITSKNTRLFVRFTFVLCCVVLLFSLCAESLITAPLIHTPPPYVTSLTSLIASAHSIIHLAHIPFALSLSHSFIPSLALAFCWNNPN